MFLLVSVRHVGAHPDGHQHGVSIQISINLGKTFLRISRIRNIPLTWILARVFVYVPPFISQILDFIYWTVLIFILIYFEWRNTENQQYGDVPLDRVWFSSFLSSTLYIILLKIEGKTERTDKVYKFICPIFWLDKTSLDQGLEKLDPDED